MAKVEAPMNASPPSGFTLFRLRAVNRSAEMPPRWVLLLDSSGDFENHSEHLAPSRNPMTSAKVS